MQQKEPPQLITTGLIAETLGVTRDRVNQVLARRRHIKPAAYAGNTRLFTSDALAQVRYELNKIDARRAEGGAS